MLEARNEEAQPFPRCEDVGVGSLAQFLFGGVTGKKVIFQERKRNV